MKPNQKGSLSKYRQEHSEIEWKKLRKVYLSYKRKRKPFENWEQEFQDYCLDYVGAIKHSISLYADCGGDFDKYDEEIEKQQKGFSIASNVAGWVNNTNQVKKTLRDHLSDVFGAYPYSVLFGTYTFREDKLPKTEEEAQKMDKIVRKVLYTYSDVFIVNRDYRPKTGALHYHWYLVADYVDYQDWDKKWGYGFSYVEHASWNSHKTANYLYKIDVLTNHATKDSANGAHIYYSTGVHRLAREKKEKGMIVREPLFD